MPDINAINKKTGKSFVKRNISEVLKKSGDTMMTKVAASPLKADRNLLNKSMLKQLEKGISQQLKNFKLATRASMNISNMSGIHEELQSN